MAGGVVVELMPWLPRLVGADEGRRLRLGIDLQAEESVQQLLLRFAAEYPALLRELWDAERGELRQPIEVAVNGSVLGIHHQLNSPLGPGDEILLLPQYQGG